jgi:replicative superfamily II helicase
MAARTAGALIAFKTGAGRACILMILYIKSFQINSKQAREAIVYVVPTPAKTHGSR